MSLNGPGGHHYHHHLQLPHHLPGVGECPGQRTLHGDECVLLLVTVHIVGIDVVRLLVVVIPGQDDSSVIVAQDISISVLRNTELARRSSP